MVVFPNYMVLPVRRKYSTRDRYGKMRRALRKATFRNVTGPWICDPLGYSTENKTQQATAQSSKRSRARHKMLRTTGDEHRRQLETSSVRRKKCTRKWFQPYVVYKKSILNKIIYTIQNKIRKKTWMKRNFHVRSQNFQDA